MTITTTAYISLGSNQDNPVYQLHSALADLVEIPETTLQRISHFYRTSPVGYAEQADFVNAVAEIETNASPQDLLTGLQSIEVNHGRQRHTRWGPRSLDLDIVLFGDKNVSEHGLNIPHPEMENRLFVLVPLKELLPGLRLSTGVTIESRIRELQKATEQSIEVIESEDAREVFN